MQKLTITVEDELYKALYAQIGRGKISRYMSEATKVKLRKDRDREKIRSGYAAMAADEEYEKEAKEWIEGLIGDVGDEPW
jgi:metal-responsive CopG/Arc/MetJ family transcriptional regulator